ncbi:hypothetical protein MHY85_20075, partial [Cellulomonas sp. ACRRI]|uniref:hypothetical protein n=1 Tax=Cellulomonas sp. ACRRI TaxID=2918188 RepID=UPI001EF17BA0
MTEFGFAGERCDANGLLYLRARWYDPATASFLDPRDAEPVTPSAAEPEETRAATARTQHFAWDASGAIPLLIG